MLTGVRTRFAPSPSGYLHSGNLVNALATSWLARQHGGELALRIDDDDRDRYQPEYVAYIFASLDALDIVWQLGPSNMDEYVQCDVQVRHRYLRKQLSKLPQDMTFACACTRSLLVERPCTCRELRLQHIEGETVLRVYVPDDCVVEVSGTPIHVKSQLGDFVVWRRDGIPAFHWANAIYDRDLGTTHIVRGSDLRITSAANIYLAGLIGADNLQKAVYLHHDLVRGPDGHKLSKTSMNSPVPPALNARTIDRIRALARTVVEPLGIRPS